jgi:hypothetical protein
MSMMRSRHINMLTKKAFSYHSAYRRSMSSFNIDWFHLKTLATTPSKQKELKSELLKIALENSMKTLKYPVIVTSIALKSQTIENFEIALMVLHDISLSPSIYFANLLELINKCLDKSLLEEALIAFSYIVGMKKTLDSLTAERIVNTLIASADLSQLDYVMRHSTISDTLLIKTAEIYIISGRISSYFMLVDSYLHHPSTLLPSSKSVSQIIRAIMYARLRRYHGRTSTSNEEYESMGKIFESIESYHRKLQKRDGLTSEEIESLESYFSYIQLYQIESESIKLPRAHVSSMMSEALSIMPIFLPSTLAFVLEDRNLPRGYSSSSDRSSMTVHDLTSDLADLRGDSGPFLLYARELFQDDYDKEIESLSRQSNTAQIVKNIVSMVASYPQIFGNSLSVMTASDPDDDEVGIRLSAGRTATLTAHLLMLIDI